MSDPPEPERPAPPPRPSTPDRTNESMGIRTPPPRPATEFAPRSGIPMTTIVLGILLVLVGIGWLLQATGAAEVPWGALIPGALLVVGVVLMIASRTGAHGGLIGLGVALTLATLLFSTLDIPFRGGIGDRDEAPVSVAELEPRYDLAVGDLTVDLTALDAPAGTTEVEASVGIGQLVVEIPEEMDLRIEADTSLGNLHVLDRRESGFGSSVVVVDSGYETATERVSLVLSVGLGSLRVER